MLSNYFLPLSRFQYLCHDDANDSSKSSTTTFRVIYTKMISMLRFKRNEETHADKVLPLNQMYLVLNDAHDMHSRTIHVRTL